MRTKLKSLINTNSSVSYKKYIKIPLNSSSFFFISLLAGQVYSFMCLQELYRENKLLSLKNSENFNSINTQINELKTLTTELVKLNNSNSLDVKITGLKSVTTNPHSDLFSSSFFLELANSPFFISGMQVTLAVLGVYGLSKVVSSFLPVLGKNIITSLKINSLYFFKGVKSKYFLSIPVINGLHRYLNQGTSELVGSAKDLDPFFLTGQLSSDNTLSDILVTLDSNSTVPLLTILTAYTSTKMLSNSSILKNTEELNPTLDSEDEGTQSSLPVVNEISSTTETSTLEETENVVNTESEVEPSTRTDSEFMSFLHESFTTY